MTTEEAPNEPPDPVTVFRDRRLTNHSFAFDPNFKGPVS